MKSRDYTNVADIMEALAEFHTVFGHPVGQPLYIRDEDTGWISARFSDNCWPDTWRLRRSLIGEEYGELVVAANAGDVLGVADALADLTYVIVGTAVVYGSPHEWLTGFGGLTSQSTRPVITEFGTGVFPAEGDELIAEFTRHYAEYYAAAGAGNSGAVCRSLATLHRAVVITAQAYGIPLDAMFAEVHRSNMSKLGPDNRPVYRSDGKVTKGPNYEPPSLALALADHHQRSMAGTRAAG